MKVTQRTDVRVSHEPFIAPPPQRAPSASLRLSEPPASPRPPSFFEAPFHTFTPSTMGAALGRAVKLGGVAAAGALMMACAGLPQQDASTRCVRVHGAPLTLLESTATPRTHAPSTASRTLGATFEALKTIGGGPASARLLEDNLHAWNARWEILEGATTSIDATYFILDKDPTGFAFLGHLLKKQRAGVEVRLMIDALGTQGFKLPGLGKDYLQELAGAGSFVAVYHPLWQRPAELNSYAFMASNHDKILTVDHLWSVTGGRNNTLDYFADPKDRPTSMRDTDVLLEGTGPAKALVAAIDAELAHEEVISKVLPDSLGNWDRRDLELIGAYAMMDLWLKAPSFTEAEKASLRANPNRRTVIATELVARALARLPSDGIHRAAKDDERTFLMEQAEALVANLELRGSQARYRTEAHNSHATDVKILDQTSVAGERVNDFDVALLSLTDAAQETIVFENPYVVLTEEMLSALERASARGVEIIIGTNSPLSTDSAVTQAFFLEDWPYILARVPTARIFVATGDRKLHAKAATIDDEISIVSSYNMDLLSGYVNSEIGAVVRSEAFNKDMKAAFLRDRDNPANGVLEYKIRKDAGGKAVLRDGEPIPVFGPENHLPQRVLEDYVGQRKNWGKMRDSLPYFRPLRHPKLTCDPTMG